ncbi:MULTISPECIES: formate/nitrite transporter family protein [unclassified Arthrobacter]|uniref:formate/nitrite transporter family protein n=1 Tax=unclassified Arthrobacter TaxID=235627 RepID=UPI001D152360|nr:MULTISPECIES: formate/nitrite transporter family protein [unclassified Arthrobacter]MCC3278580.1 formate/nitrite transporter family protein [Arthrobacter sp. zg-Y40]MCC9176947.1 formate/nitrite transporter family protein [Arthrobacter sp. zg-Y750]MDK1326341.1 formate/nitrite transporter family protein [Arthrobacter sp. zg-Y1143]
MSEERRREIGSSEAPVEDELQESFENTVTEGAERLHRTFRTILITGVFGGLEVGLGVMAYLAVMHETGDHLLAGIAFSVGLIALFLAHSELFTENFLMPVAAVAAKEGSVKQLAKLWAGTLVANLAGGWVFMWIVMQAFPQWAPTVAESAKHFTEAPFSLQTVALAILGGSTITLMSRMQQGTSSDPAKIVATVIGGFLLAGLQLFHSILDSLLIFGALQSGAEITYLQWLGWFGYTLLFNMVGGLVLVTALRLVRTKELLAQRRRDAPEDPDAAHRDA